MFKVFTVNLSPDLAIADASFGSHACGELEPAAVATLLGKLAAIDPVQNHEHDPQVIVQTREERFLVRNNGGRLWLYNGRDSSQPGVELALPALLEALGAGPHHAGTVEDGVAEPLAPAAPPSKYHGAFAVALLVLGLGLNGWGIYQFMAQEKDPPPPPLSPIKDDSQHQLLRRQLAGTYATGGEPGDRAINLSADGTIKLLVLIPDPAGGTKSAVMATDTFTVGLSVSGQQFLATQASGRIEIGPDGALLYYGDTYQREVARAKP